MVRIHAYCEGLVGTDDGMRWVGPDACANVSRGRNLVARSWAERVLRHTGLLDRPHSAESAWLSAI